jgi:uncharacterized protein
MRIEQHGEDVLLWVTAVPGASRNQLAGAVGDRLKVRIAAPPEGGKANEAICRAIAEALGLKPRQVVIESGHAGAAKTVRIGGASLAAVRAALDRP